MTTPVTLDAALAAVRNVGDGPRLLEQANRIADGLEAQNTELRRRIDAARELLSLRSCNPKWGGVPCTETDCLGCQVADALGGGT